MSKQNGIIYQLLQERDIEQAINCLIDVFTSAEPITKELKISPNEFDHFAKIICQKYVEDKFSMIAKEPVNYQVVGFIISQDLSNKLSEEIYNNICQNQKMNTLFQFLKELNEQYEIHKTNLISKVFSIFLLGVREEYKNKNIGNKLLEHNLKIASKEKFSLVKVEATGNKSQHIFRNYGFKDKCSIDYQNYEYQGIKIFEGIKEHKSCILMEKLLIPLS